MLEEKVESENLENKAEEVHEIKEEVKQIEQMELKLEEPSNSMVSTKFDHFGNVQEMLNFAETLIKSGLVPSGIGTPEKVVAIILQGKELGIPPVTALNNIHNIKGKVSLGVHVITALVRNRGIRYKIIKDAELVYGEGTDKAPTDRITTIRFYEKWGNEVIENDISFTYKEAMKQGLHEKDNYKKMLPLMLRTRCLTIGCRFVCPEALSGIYETSELADMNNATYDIDDQGNVSNLKN